MFGFNFDRKGFVGRIRTRNVAPGNQMGPKLRHKSSVEQRSGNPVILVPGYRDNSTVFRRLTNYLRENAFEVHALSLQPSDGRLPLDRLAEQVAAYVDASFDDRPLDFVGFSMGGLVLRYYLQRLNGLARAERFVTLGSPHRGTLMAYYSSLPGVRQMRPRSLFLQDLAQDEEMLGQIQFTSIWTPLDLTIMPSSSSITAVGRQQRLFVPYHRALVTHDLSLQSVVQALLEPMTAN